MENTLLATVAVAALAFGLVSRKAERSPLTPPMFFLVAGFVLGGSGLGLVRLEGGGGPIHVLAELTLALVLFTDAARIDLGRLRRERNLPARLLGLGMPLTIVAGAGTALLLLPELDLSSALLLAAILAPTDAALGQAVVSSSLVPVRIRQTLNVESGLNDGIALPVVLVLASVVDPGGVQETVGGWLRFAALQVTLGPLVGAVVGTTGGRIVDAAVRAGWINAPFERLSALGLALLAFAGAELAGGNGFIATFVAGLMLGTLARGSCEPLYEFAEAEGQMLTLLVFLILGGVLVPLALPHVDAVVIAYAVASLTVVRMVPVTLSLLGAGLRPASVAFIGWFGPRGLASLLFVLVVIEGMLDQVGRLEATVITTVVLSTLLHGITAYPLARRYHGMTRDRERHAAEHAGMAEMPVRVRHAAD